MDAVLAAVGARRLVEHDDAIAYGKVFPEFWIHPPLDERKATAGNGTHLAFFAESREAVDAFHRIALEQGGTCEGKPGDRGGGFYAAYFRDLDGNKLNAFCMVAAD